MTYMRSYLGAHKPASKHFSLKLTAHTGLNIGLSFNISIYLRRLRIEYEDIAAVAEHTWTHKSSGTQQSYSNTR